MKNAQGEIQNGEDQEVKSIFGSKVEKPLLNDLTRKEKEDFTITDTGSVEEEVVEKPVIKEAPLLWEEPVIYQIEFINNKGEDIVMFSYSAPIIENNVLTLLKPFGKIELKESVLKRKMVSIACKSKQLGDEFSLSLKQGIVLKCILTKEAWLNRSYEETKDQFDRLVLEVYRELSAKLSVNIPAQTPGEVYEPIGPQPSQRKQTKQQVDYYSQGNLPVEGDRRGLVNF